MNKPERLQRAMPMDDSAWRNIIGDHQDAVFRLAFLLVRDAETADDLAQDTFIRAYQAIERFDRSRPMRPWLLSITINLARNHHRSFSRYINAIRRWWREVPSSHSLEGIAQANMEAEALGQAVRRLQSSDRELVALRFFMELSEQECADVLGIARGTVKSRQHRALERLRRIISEEFPALWEGRTREAGT